MTQIYLTPKELEVLQTYCHHSEGMPSLETMRILAKIIGEASKLERELDAYDKDNNLLPWYYNQYMSHQALVVENRGPHPRPLTREGGEVLACGGGQ